jgi:hypothetical protein
MQKKCVHRNGAMAESPRYQRCRSASIVASTRAFGRVKRRSVTAMLWSVLDLKSSQVRGQAVSV